MRPTKRPAPKRDDRPKDRRAGWLVRAALVGVALLAYSDSFGLGLAQDSRVMVAHDTRIREASARNLALILQKHYWWPVPGDRLYRPVTTASLLFNYAVLGNGGNAAGYHWINFLLHAANVLLAYELALLLFRRAGPAFFAAALWAAHPAATESVANIVGRADLLATMAVLGGLLYYIRLTSHAGPRRGLRAAGLFAIACAGVFSKESAAVLAGVMLLWDLSFPIGETRAGMRRRMPAYAAVAASLAVLWLVRAWVFSGAAWPQSVYIDNPLQSAGFWTARFTAIKVIGKYLWLLACPLHLSSDYSYSQIPLAGWGDGAAWLAAGAVAAILAAAVARRRKDPLMFFLAGLFGIALLPVSNLIFPIRSIMAERFLYLPSLAFAFAVVGLLYRLPPGRFVPVALCALLALYAARTFARNLDWQDNLSLASADVRTCPRSFRLRDTLAKALWEQDDRRNIDAAIREEEVSWATVEPLPVERSSELPPTYLGIYYAFKADLVGGASNPQSRLWYEKSIAVLLRARSLSQAAGRAFDDAQLAHGKPLGVRTGMPELYLALGSDYSSLARHAEAVEAFLQGRSLQPGMLSFYDGLAGDYWAMGQYDRAVTALEAKGMLDGFAPATVAGIAQMYANMPGAACAVESRGAGPQFNPNCPKVKSDLCQAASDLAQAFTDARNPAQAGTFRAEAAQRYGCAI
jgi:tetratricopeptide (TPR) repeat protein